MKWTNVKIGSRLALLGLTGFFAPAAMGSEGACRPATAVNPGYTSGEVDRKCGGSGPAKNACTDTHRDILTKYNEYTAKVQAACQTANQALQNIGQVQQKNAQGKTKEIAGNAATAMENLVQAGEKIQDDLLKRSRDKHLSELKKPNTSTYLQQANSWSPRFMNKTSFANSGLNAPLDAGKPDVANHVNALNSTTSFIHKLTLDLKERKEAAGKLRSQSDIAGQNEENGGAEKDEKGGKGMDPSALAGPLAGLAGMAGQQANKGSDSSSLTDPLAGQNPAATTTPENITPAPATVKAASVATNKAGASTDASKTGSGGKNGAGFENSLGAGSGLSAGSGSGPYPDAFTGVGPEGTSSSFGGAVGTSSFGGGAGAGSSTGASSSPGSGDTAAGADGGAGHSDDEALSAFGGGGLNFSGGASSSGSSSSGEEPVKDFLEDAATSFDGTEFAEENGELDGSLESAGVQGEDGTELFRRVRSALERSQRKGAVMSGLGAGHRTR